MVEVVKDGGDVLTCYQLMKSVSKDKLKEWIEKWEDLADFDIVPVIDTKEARAKILG